MTSANVTEYTITKKKTGEVAGHHRQHHYCKTNWDDLVRKFYPLEDYMIQAHGYDEEEEPWEEEPEELYEFLIRIGFIELR